MNTSTKIFWTCLSLALIGLLIWWNFFVGIISLLTAFPLYLIRNYLKKKYPKYGNSIFWVILIGIIIIILCLHIGRILFFLGSIIGVYILVKLVEFVWTRIIADEEKTGSGFLKWLFTSGNSLFNPGSSPG